MKEIFLSSLLTDFYPKNLFTAKSHPFPMRLNAIWKDPEGNQAWGNQ